jgi:hypothetical protein
MWLFHSTSEDCETQRCRAQADTAVSLASLEAAEVASTSCTTQWLFGAAGKTTDGNPGVSPV